jgi:anionic cell wall polymer biosynthesis LytR-Cps2A-Psr (LCP) family protein
MDLSILKSIRETIGRHTKGIFLGTLFVGLFLVSTATSYFYLSKVVVKSQEPEISQPELTPTHGFPVVHNLPVVQDLLAGYNVLLLGYGGPGHDGSYLADVLMVAHIEPEEKKVVLISVPRDLWVSIPIRSDQSKNFKINAAFAVGSDDKRYPLKESIYTGEFGGGEMAKRVVGDVVGMPIDLFIAVDFEGFKKAIDILEGIEVDVPVAFDDYFYPVKGLENETCGKSPEEITKIHEEFSGFQLEKQFECRYEHIHFDTGVQLMDGETALKFVRSRHSEQHGGDFARSQRQQALLSAIKNKLLSIYSVDDAIPFINQFSSVVQTDVVGAVIKEFVTTIGDPKGYEISYVNLTTENVLAQTTTGAGQFIIVPKEGVGEWKAVHQFIGEEIAKLTTN